MTKFLVAIILCCMLVTVATAGIRRVGLNQTYTTLTAAYTAAVNDDTLLISPGVYSETITSTKRLHWIGAGYDLVTINGAIAMNAGSSGSRLEGLQAVGNVSDAIIGLGGGVDLIAVARCWIVNVATNNNTTHASCIRRTSAPGGNLLIVGCILEHYTNLWGGGQGLQCYCIGLNGDNAVIHNSIFARRDAVASDAATALFGVPQSLDLQNCIFASYRKLLNMTNSFALNFQNNIAHDWIGSGNWGTYPGGGTGWSYNASTTVAPPGTDGILLPGDPFVSYNETANYIYGSSDLHLAGGSPCINAGDPAILDLDGSRSDMGIYGGPTPHVDGGAPNYPFTIAFDVPSSMTAGQQLPIQATGRIGAGY